MFFEFLLVLGGLVAWMYLRFRQRSHYWTRMGVKQPASNPFPFGNNIVVHPDAIMLRKNQVSFF